MDTVFNDYDGMYGSTAAGSADEAGVEKAEEDTGLIFNEIREMESIAYDVAEPDQIVSYDAAGLEEYFGTKICPTSIPDGFILWNYGHSGMLSDRADWRV